MTQPTVVENFVTNTGQFTVIGTGSHGPDTFTFTGGQGVLNNTGAGTNGTTAVDTANMPIVANQFFVYAMIGSPGLPQAATGSYINFCPGIFLDANNLLAFEFGGVDPVANGFYSLDILLFVAGVQHNLALGTVSNATTPMAVGISVDDNTVTGWGLYASGWVQLTSIDVSPYIDFTAAGALTGYHAGVGLNTGNRGTLAASQLWSGPLDQLAVCDPYWNNVALLLPFNGSYTDISVNALTVTNQGGALLTSAAKFGSGALDLSTHVTQDTCVSVPVALNGPLDLANIQEWTIEGWLNSVALGGFGQEYLCVGTFAVSGGGFVNGVVLEAGTGTSFGMSIYGATHSTGERPQVATTANAYHHFAMVKRASVGGAAGDQYQLFVDGVGSGWTNSSSPFTGPYASWQGQFVVGGYYKDDGTYNGGNTAHGKAFFDDVRVTAGVARYTADFTPPAQPATTFSCGTTIPDVSNTTLAAGEATIVGLGLVVGTVASTCDNTIPAGFIISTTPAIGSLVAPGTVVNFLISSGLCTNVQLTAKFVSAMISKAIMTANPGQINPRIYPPYDDNTVRVVPPRIVI